MDYGDIHNNGADGHLLFHISMNRRTFLASGVAASLATQLPGEPPQPMTPQSATPSAKPRNLLFLMVDDLNLALGCCGHPAVYTPNIDRLAARGLRFANAFCPYPLCGPSRSALMTGRRPETLQMPNNEVAWRDNLPDLKTLPEELRAAGFHTQRAGKIFHHGISKKYPTDPQQEGVSLPHTLFDPPSWTVEEGTVAGPYERGAPGPEQLINGRAYGGTSLHTIRATDASRLPDTLIANWAEAFLHSDKAQEGPFMLAAGFHKPHVPLIAPEKWWAFYENLDVESLVPSTFFTAAELPQGTFLRGGDPHRGADEEQRRHLYKGYLACVSFMDEQLGRVLNALEANALTDDTLITFVADHGYHIGEQGQWDKMMLLDPSLRVPMILAGPGIPQGATCQAHVESLDLNPTLRNLMGLPSDPDNEGTDLTPWIENPAKPSTRPTYSWVKAGKRQGWGIRTQTHRLGLMSWEGGGPQPFLFDMAKDPHETTNLAGQQEVSAIQAELKGKLRQHFARTAPIPA